jgi:hypothetical protein
MGIENEKIFQNMSENDRLRVFDLLNERPRQPVKDVRQREAMGLEEKQAIDYALSQNPKSASEFVEQFQMYKAVLSNSQTDKVQEYQSAIARIAQEEYGKALDTLSPKQQIEIRRKASEEVLGEAIDGKDAFSRAAYVKGVENAGNSEDPTKVSAETKAKVQETYQDKLKDFGGRTGGSQVDPDLPSDQLIQQIQTLDKNGEIKFETESAGVYHVEKHYENEIPNSERTEGRTDVDNYLLSASNTIQSSNSNIVYDQSGNRIISFKREIVADNGKVRNALAIVKISPDGEVKLATYHVPGS